VGNWRESLDIFLQGWKGNMDITGAMVCGSFITGNPSKHSDIDVHLILSDDLDWRERGNKVVDGYLIEYFINPPKQIRCYFLQNYRDRKPMSIVQFLTGEILFDKTGDIDFLKNEARKWFNKAYEAQSNSTIELKKYLIWDMWDNLQDCVEKGRVDIPFVYMNSLQLLFSHYCEFLRLENIPYYQIVAYLTDESYLVKYLKKPFPDLEFIGLYLSAIQENDTLKMMVRYTALTELVLQKMGGFNIDGWKMRSDLDL
jgi:predicted nucleotidyltransferase